MSKPLPVIYQKLGEIPLTFFKLYLPSYCCPQCGMKGLFVKVSANDGKALTEYWELEGPRENFENMKGLELHQGVAAQGGFKCEPTRESRVVDHLDIFGEARVRSSHLVRALVQANLFIKNHAPVGPASLPHYPPTFRESAKVGVSGQRERSGGVGQLDLPPTTGAGKRKLSAFSSFFQPPRSSARPTAPRAQGVSE